MATFPIFRRGFVPPRKKQKFLVNENENKNENKIKYEKEGRKRSFQTSWLEEFSWLSYEEGRMKCKVCSAYDDSGPLVIGSTVFRKNCLQSHEKSDAHLKFVIIEKAKKNPSSTVAMRTLQHLNEMTVSQLKVKFRNTHFLCKQGRPFVDYPELCYLDEMKGIDVGNQYRSDKSAATFCHYIAEAERNKIRQNLEMSNFVSVISDGTTDSSFQETEIVYVRSCHKGKIDVYFSIVKNVPRGDSETIARVLVEGLEMLCPDYNSKLVGTGTDGASTMLGSKSGAVQRLRELTKRPYIVGIHCSGHKLELAFKDSLKAKIPLFNKVELLMINIYYFYRNSNVTRNGLKDSYRALGKKILLPTRVGGTRWLGHLEKSIQIYIKGYSAFVQHLGQLQNQDGFTGHSVKGNKAIHFYKASKSRDVWFMLHFLLDVLSILSSVSKTFQDRRADIQSILTEINMAITAIEKLETRDGFYMRKAISEPPSDLTGNEKGFISARKRLLSTIVDALHRRFTDNPGILAACSTLNLSVFPTKSDAEDYGDKDIDTLVDYFEPALSAAGVDVAAIASEWSKLKSHMLTRYQNPQETNWEDVNVKLGQVCPNLLQLVNLVLTIPASSADAERGFSQLKNLKTDRRTRLQDVTLCDQMAVLLESGDIKDFDPLPAILLWMKPERRVQQVQLPTKSQQKPVMDENQNVIVPDVCTDEASISNCNTTVVPVDVEHDSSESQNLCNEPVEILPKVTTYSGDCNTSSELVEPKSVSPHIEDVQIQFSDKSVQAFCHECVSFPFIAAELEDKSVQVEINSMSRGDFCSEFDETYESDGDYNFEYNDSEVGVGENKQTFSERLECAGRAFLEFTEVCSGEMRISGE